MKMTVNRMMFFIIALLIPTMGLTETKPTSFLDGVKAYQVKDYKKAQGIFASLSREYPNNPNLLFNLGLSEFYLQRPGLALGLWRKAKFIDKNFSPAQKATSYAEDHLFPDRKRPSLLENLYHWATELPLHLWIFLSLASAFTFFWYALEYGVKLKKSPLLWPFWIYTLIVPMILSTSLSFFMYEDQNQTKATVIQENRPTHASPSPDSPSLSELRGGQLVSVEKFHGNWIQIRTLSGSPSWVPASSLILFGKSQGN